MGLEQYVGKWVITIQEIPADKRGHIIPIGTQLQVEALVGGQHFHLAYGDGSRAANQVHYSKVKTGGGG